MTPTRRARGLAQVLLLAAGLSGCSLLAGGLPGQPTVSCGAFEGPDCNDLLEIGSDAIAGARPATPAAIAVDDACPPNARCMPSVLGGPTAAVVIRWADGTLQWATIPLPVDWPAHGAGPATLEPGAPPAHLIAAVGH